MQKIAAFLGPGGSGKSTNAEHARNFLGLENAKNYTTRTQRKEKDDDYIFISVNDFKKKRRNNELFNAINFDGNFYGFDKKDIDTQEHLIISISPQALRRIKQYTQETNSQLVTVFFNAEENLLRERIVHRGITHEEANKRILTDQIENSIRPYDYDHIIQTKESREEVRNTTIKIIQKFFRAD